MSVDDAVSRLCVGVYPVVLRLWYDLWNVHVSVDVCHWMVTGCDASCVSSMISVCLTMSWHRRRQIHSRNVHYQPSQGCFHSILVFLQLTHFSYF